jgi:hypothetical protein
VLWPTWRKRCENGSRSFTMSKAARNPDVHMARLRTISEKIDELQARFRSESIRV